MNIVRSIRHLLMFLMVGVGVGLTGSIIVLQAVNVQSTTVSAATIDDVYVNFQTILPASSLTGPIDTSLIEGQMTDTAGNIYYIVRSLSASTDPDTGEAIPTAQTGASTAHQADIISAIQSGDPSTLTALQQLGFYPNGTSLTGVVYWNTIGNTAVPLTYDATNVAETNPDGSSVVNILMMISTNAITLPVNFVTDGGENIATGSITGQVGTTYFFSHDQAALQLPTGYSIVSLEKNIGTFSVDSNNQVNNEPIIVRVTKKILPLSDGGQHDDGNKPAVEVPAHQNAPEQIVQEQISSKQTAVLPATGTHENVAWLMLNLALLSLLAFGRWWVKLQHL
ncbi:hypothetical protein H9L19_05100 [Weissella diestrammenae]|uniref:LPXTG cell wall anchor domain-containing protein n=1 Tax=Weissella diestrammenae TaxID=1162633 RepID=A0A7G9T3W7_9LACO|nr:hypothetical protein [Weissella diestrammenae]MCM0582117.1 hypothetical protein [Weissella diestrammenae]QNN74792.1 hypothetical protein H9L19_05100 [Weissella diestrammenae]